MSDIRASVEEDEVGADEIADDLECPAGSVHSKVSTARDRLKAKLRKLGRGSGGRSERRKPRKEVRPSFFTVTT